MSNNVKEGKDWIMKSVNMPVVKEEMVSYVEYAKENDLKLDNLYALCEEMDLDIQDFYHLKNHQFSPYCYWKRETFQTFITLTDDSSMWDMMTTMLKKRILEVKKCLESGRFDHLFMITETVGQPLVFETVYDQLPKEDRYELFMDMYILHDYGFSNYDRDIVADAISHQSKELREKNLKSLKEKVTIQDGKITVYRGMGNESTPAEKAMSWTTSEKTAYFFANRLGTDGVVLKGTVALDEIIDFITQRSEDEVIILPGKVELVAEETMVGTEAELKILNEKNLITEYQAMRDFFISKELYLSPDGDHGVAHVKRVLLHCISLANAIGLTDSERGILMIAACYHDIGRKHDWACEEHGRWSIEKMIEEDLEEYFLLVDEDGSLYPEYLSPEELDAMHFLMEYHCINDEEANQAMKGIDEPETKKLVEKLFPIFKDADALDRVRIRDLNLKYLRTPEARQRVKFAEDVLLFLT